MCQRRITDMARSFGVLVLLLLVAQRTVTAEEDDVPTYDAIVVGAGIAGLKAAAVLSDAGMAVMVLEGRSRYGGRLDSFHGFDGNLTVDLGASWIHGIDGNPLYQLAQEVGADTVETPEEAEQVHQNGQILGEQEAISITTAAGNFFAQTAEMANDMQVTNLQDALDQAVASTDNAEDISAYSLGVGGMENDEASTASLLPAWLADQFSGGGASSGYNGTWVVFPNGYSQILEPLVVDLNITYNSTVTSIQYSAAGVVITTASGKRYRSKYAVVTIPLGALQAGTITFSPDLPAWKQEAISQLSMGNFHKTFMLFEDVFWDTSVTFHVRLPDNSSLEERNWFIYVNLANAYNKPMLLAINNGPHAVYLDNLPQEELTALAVSQLSRTFGIDVPQPLAVINSNWSNDEFTYGAYSYPGLNFTAAAQDAVFEPLSGVLWMAGEATSPDQLGYAHGGYQQGLRAAEAVLQAVQQEPSADAASEP